MAKKIDKIAELIKERDKLYVTKSNPKRLEIILKEIDYFFYGIK